MQKKITSFSSMLKVGVWGAIAAMLSMSIGCSDKALHFNKRSSNIISGTVTPLLLSQGSQSLRGPSTMGIVTTACLNSTATLYKLSSTGQRVYPAVQTVPLKSDGTYTFINTQNVGVLVKDLSSTKISFLVEVAGCNSTFARILTGSSKQDITWGTTLVSYITNSSSSGRVAIADRTNIASLYSSLMEAADYASAYATLSNEALPQFEKAFGVAPAVLETAAPMVLTLAVPTAMKEHEASNLSITAAQWKSGYSYAYLWMLDGQVISYASTTTITPHANSQGNHVVSVFYGQTDGNGQLDQSKPYLSQSFNVAVSNDVPAAAPVLSAVSTNVNSPSVSLRINTGTSMANCESFTSLALTEDSPIAPLSAASYNISCTQAPLQSVAYSLAGGTGNHTLYLWARDAAGNVSTAPQTLSVQYNNLTPQITVTTPSANGLPAQSTVYVVGTCDASAGDVTFTGGVSPASVATPCNSGAFSKTLTLSSGDGLKTLTASQTNSFNLTGSVTFTVLKDTTQPSVTLTSSSPNPTNSSPFSVTVTFSESVTGFDATKPVLSNGSITGFSGSGSTYSLSITPSGQGAVTVDIPQNVALDAAGNQNSQSATFSRTYDTVPSTVTLTSAAADPVNASPISVSLTFSKAVTGLSLSGLNLTNATASGLTGSGTTYSFNLIPSGQGTVSVSVKANAAQDSAGNGNSVSSALTRVYDTVAPTATLSTTASNPTNASPIPFTVVFSESVTGLSLSGFTVTNGSASSLSGSGTTYAFNVVPSSNGTVSVYVKNNAAQDAAGNQNTQSGTNSLVFNNSHPTVTLASTASATTNLTPIPVTMTFSTSVTGLSLGSLVLNNATASGLAGSGTSYSFNLIPSGQGAVSVTLPIDAAQDSASNGNLVSNTLSFTFDTTAPTLTIANPASGNYVNLDTQSALAVSGSCSEDGQTVNLAVGAVTKSLTCASGAYSTTLDLNTLSDGALTLTANHSDLAGNPATQQSVSLTKDTTMPTAILAGTPSSPSNATSLNIAVSGTGVVSYRYKVGSSSVTDCANASGYSSTTVIATNITSSVAALSDSAVKVCVVGRNAAGNDQTYASATIATWTKDTTVSNFSGLALSPSSIGNVTTPSISGQTEALAIVQMYSLPSCLGSLLGNITAASDGSFTVTPGASIGADGSYSFSVQATDVAGNVMCSPTSFAYTLDTVAPTVSLSSTASSSTNVSPIPVTATFSESVTGLILSGISVTNGTASGLTGSGANYSFNVTPSAQGAVTVTIPGSKAVDSAQNPNTTSLTLSRTYDSTAPTLTITSPLANTNFNTPSLTIAGACENGLSIVIGGSGASSPASASCVSGAYSVAVTVTAGNGTKNVSFTQTDAAGNETTVSRAFVLDTTAPSLTFTSSAVQNQNTSTNTVSFTGNCETGLSITVAGGTDSSVATCSGGAWSYTTVARATDASRTYTFTQTDAAGNSTALTGTWVRDTVAPALTLTSPAANFSAQTGVTLTGACETGLTIAISGAGILSSVSIPCSSGSYSQYVYFSSGDGTKAVSLSQTDAAGNSTPLSRNFVRDTAPPTLTQTTRTSPYYSNSNTVSFGGACETGLTVTVSGTDTSTATCTGSAWSYTTASQTTDATRSYTFTQTDSSGNSTQISANWVRDTVAPTLTFTSSSSFVTSGNSVTFAGTCDSGLTITVSGAQSATTSCSGGTWSYAASQSSDNTYNYTFTELDQAGNSSAISGSWVRSTVGPTITVTQTSPQTTNGSALTISGTCSGGSAGSNGVITISGDVSATATCSSTTSSPGTWSYSASQGSDGSYIYNFTVTDNFSTPRSSAASLIWKRDATPPQLSAGTFTINGGVSPTGVSFNPVSFTATDNSTTVTKFCLKTSNSAPAANDACWYPVNGAATNVNPANSVSISGYPFNVGITPQAYNIYLWAMDGATNISVNAGTTGKDLTSITYAPVASPVVSTVIASNSDTMNAALAERTISGGADLYVRWTASGANLGATPVKIYFTSDDNTWTALTGNIANGQNNCSSLTGSGSAATTASGCYKLTNGSPSSSYYRVRVSVTNTYNTSTYSNSLPINGGALQIIAGNTETGLNGSAASALFQAYYGGQTADAESLVVNSKGVIYFRDITLGLLKVDPADGTVVQLIPLGAATSGYGDGGSIANAKLRYPSSIAIDQTDRIWIYDYDRIRRVDFSTSPATINTIIGGGSNTADTVATPTQLKFSFNADFYSTGSYRAPMIVSPAGDVYFYSDSKSMILNQRLRIYKASTGQVTSLYISGSSSSLSDQGSSYAIADATKCGSGTPHIQFDPATGAILNLYFALSMMDTNTGCTTPAIPTNINIQGLMRFNPTTGALDTSQVPANYTYQLNRSNNAYHITAMDGNIYMVNRGQGSIHKFDPSTNTYTSLAGNGNKDGCIDGTAALSCGIDFGGAFVDAQSRLYFVDKGRIRTVVNNAIVTLYGRSSDYGDGGLATDARLSIAGGVLQRSDGKILINDQGASKFRLFSRGGNIIAIAGNGNSNTTTNTVSGATNLPLYVPTSTLLPLFLNSSDDILFITHNYTWRRLASTYATSPSTTPWSPVKDGNNNQIFSGSTYAFHSASANGQPAGSISPPNLMMSATAYNGTSILIYMDQTSNANSIYGEVNLSTGLYTINLGPISSTSGLCADGVPISTCTTNRGPSFVVGGYDSVNSLWLIPDPLNTKAIRTMGTGGGGALQTATTFANAPTAFVFKRFAGHSTHAYYYYCSSSNGRIYLRDGTTSTEVALNWPISSIKCTGSQMVYDASTDSLIFAMTQNGLYGIAELTGVHPSVNGL